MSARGVLLEAAVGAGHLSSAAARGGETLMRSRGLGAGYGDRASAQARGDEGEAVGAHGRDHGQDAESELLGKGS